MRWHFHPRLLLSVKMNYGIKGNFDFVEIQLASYLGGKKSVLQKEEINLCLKMAPYFTTETLKK